MTDSTPNSSPELEQTERKIWVERATQFGMLYTKIRFQTTSANFAFCSALIALSGKFQINPNLMITSLFTIAFLSGVLIYFINKSIIYTNKQVSILRGPSENIIHELADISKLRSDSFQGSRFISQTKIWVAVNALYPTAIAVALLISENSLTSH